MSIKAKPYIPLDRDILKIIEKYYKIRDVEDILNRFCFSNPQLETHVCNTLVLEDEEGCEHCRNIPANFNCQITCDISHICHAAYAQRLGMGGKDILKAVKNNSELSYERLLEEIEKHINTGKNIKEEIEDELEGNSILEEEETAEEIFITMGEEEMEEVIITEETEQPTVGGADLHEGEELFTCKQVADILGCTLVNIYLKISKGKIKVVGPARKHRIPASELEKLKAQSRTYKKRQAVKEEVAE